jgi:hypothetical protein
MRARYRMMSLSNDDRLRRGQKKSLILSLIPEKAGKGEADF